MALSQAILSQFHLIKIQIRWWVFRLTDLLCFNWLLGFSWLSSSQLDFIAHEVPSNLDKQEFKWQLFKNFFFKFKSCVCVWCFCVCMCVYDVSVCVYGVSVYICVFMMFVWVFVCVCRCHSVDMEVKRHSSVSPPFLSEGLILVACYCIGQVNWFVGFRGSPVSTFHFTVGD